ncbi:MAG: glycoside hydrolase family 3 protein [Ruminococcus sp.]|nr:glycoside hydrolase family 3 protein [Ruminococcus sp.]
MAQYRHAKGPSPLQIFIVVLVVLLSIGVIAGAAFAVYHFGFDKEEEVPTQAPVVPTIATFDEAPTEPATEDLDAKYEQLAKTYVSNMSDDEKIYQLLITTPESLTGVDAATMAGDATKAAIEAKPVAGIVYDTINFEDSAQTTELIKTTQSFAKTSMFIAVAEEGGENSPVASKLGTTVFEATSTYVSQGEQKSFDNATQMAKDLTKFGFNLNLAPIANLEGDNAYSTDAAMASPLVAQGIKGLQENGVISALKTFPVKTDTDKSVDDLKASELLPFTAGIANNCGIIVAGDAVLSSIDADNPAFMSKNVIAEILVKELKYNGVVMTSDLSTDYITGNFTTDQIVENALNAGVNLFFKPSDLDAYVEAIKNAVANGKVTQQQIDDSVTKIIALKYKYGILSETANASAPTATEVATETSTEIATEAATQTATQ